MAPLGCRRRPRTRPLNSQKHTHSHTQLVHAHTHNAHTGSKRHTATRSPHTAPNPHSASLFFPSPSTPAPLSPSLPLQVTACRCPASTHPPLSRLPFQAVLCSLVTASLWSRSSFRFHRLDSVFPFSLSLLLAPLYVVSLLVSIPFLSLHASVHRPSHLVARRQVFASLLHSHIHLRHPRPRRVSASAPAYSDSVVLFSLFTPLRHAWSLQSSFRHPCTILPFWSLGPFAQFRLHTPTAL